VMEGLLPWHSTLTLTKQRRVQTVCKRHGQYYKRRILFVTAPLTVANCSIIRGNIRRISSFPCGYKCYVHYGDLILRELDCIVIISLGYIL
jgi:hypothetical protein